jgi:nucleoside-diphosphate-sugar epimerase
MILVTGATGLVGSQLLYDLAAAGETVRALRRPNRSRVLADRALGANPSLASRVQWVEGDVTDLFSVEDALQGVDTVFHCAAVVSFHPARRKELMKVNVEGTANMVQAALQSGVRRFCYVSSTAALGSASGEDLVTETTPWQPDPGLSAYALSKHRSEREVWRGIEEGLPAFIVNPSIVLGAGDPDAGSSALFGAVRRGLRFFPTGSTGWVDVRDVTRCMLSLAARDVVGKRYILNSENLPYRDVMQAMADAFGVPGPAYPVGQLLGAIGWRAEALRSLFRTRPPMITRETVRSGAEHRRYSNERVCAELGIAFLPVRQSVADHCTTYRSWPGSSG